jgi:glycosyltransferase involved in cell wall biosynthesis
LADKKKYKILVVLRWLGGIRTFCRYVYNEFDKDRFAITFLAPDVPEMHHLLDDLKNQDIHYIPIKCDPAHANLDLITVYKTILGGDFDLVHSQGFTAGAYSAIPAYIKKIPHMMTLHEVFTDDQFAGWKGHLKKTLIRSVVPLIDCVHCVSHSAGRNFLEYLPNMKNNGKMIVVPNGIEAVRFLNPEKRNLRKEQSLKDDTFLIGFLGRFMSPKGFRYLIDALNILVNKRRTSRKPIVIAVNDGGFLSAEKRRIAELGLNEYVTFMPFQPNVAPIIKGLDVVVMPSLWEGCGLLTMETLVSGVPFIGTDIPPIKEMLEGTPGKMVPPRDAESLAEAICQELENPSRKETEEFALSAADRFDVREKANRLQDIIIKLIINQKEKSS